MGLFDNFDFQDIGDLASTFLYGRRSSNPYDVQSGFSDTIGDVANKGVGLISGLFHNLQRPQGALFATLIGDSAVEGFKNPERYSGSQLPIIKDIQDETWRNYLGGAAEIVADPLNLIPFGGVAYKGASGVRGVAKVAGKNILANYAANTGARLGGDVAGKVAQEMNLSPEVQNIVTLTGGLIGGGAAGGRALRTLNAKTVGKMVEEQFAENAPTYADYINEITKNDGIHVLDAKGNTVHIAQSYGEARDWAIQNMPAEYNNLSFVKHDTLQTKIAEHSLEEYDIGNDGNVYRIDKAPDNSELIDRNVHIIPYTKAPIDETLGELYSRHAEKPYPNIVTAWVGYTGDPNNINDVGPQLRRAYVEGNYPVIKAIDGMAEDWRQDAIKRSYTNPTPFLQNGMGYFYRGERIYDYNTGVTKPLGEKHFPVSGWTDRPDVAARFGTTKDIINPITGVRESTIIIIGKWIPLEDVSAPIGKGMDEHEYLVMDRNQIPDNVWQELRGTPKDAPAGTLKYAIINPRTGETLRYVDTEAEAIKATEKGTVASDNGEWALTDGNNITEKGLTKEQALRAQDSNPGLRAVLYNSNIDINLDYQPVLRGYTPEVNIANADRLAAETGSDPTLKDKFLGMFDNPKLGIVDEEDNLSRDIQGHLYELPHEAVAGDKLANDLSGNGGGMPPKPPTSTGGTVPPDSNSGNLNNSKNDNISKSGVNPDVAIDPVSLSKVAQEKVATDLLNKMGISTPSQEIFDLARDNYVSARGNPGKWYDLEHINSLIRGVWATGDGSWIGIQGLLTIPRLILKGDLRDAGDVVMIPLLTLFGNKSARNNFLQRVIETRPLGAPTLSEAVKDYGLHLSMLQGVPDFNFNLFERIPGVNKIFRPEDAFMAAGDTARISMFYNEWARFGHNLTSAEDKLALGRALNRATGIAEKPFGGHLGSFALFAPRFFQSQIETIVKAVSDGTIEGQLARRQLSALIGTGVLLTAAANYSRGYDDNDMWLPFKDGKVNSNFMRIRDVAGQDISLFGPWDSLVKLVANLGTGNLAYARSKFSPLLGVAANILAGETFIGEDYHDPKVVLKSLLLPFAWQQIGTEKAGFLGNGLNFFGVKSSPLSKSEQLEANMVNMGLNPQDPLQRRQFLAEHPEQKPLYDKKDIEIQGIQADIKSRSALNDQKTLNNEQSLTDYRENRKILGRESRAKLEVLLKNSDFKPNTLQYQWIDSYFKLFDDARDPITHDVMGQKFDQLQAEWLAKYGPQAFDYLQKYQLIGKSDIETQYLTDMKKLRDLGYFDTKKYVSFIYQSGLTDDQIAEYRDQVSAARNTNKQLAAMDFKDAIYQVFRGKLSNAQINALGLAGSQDYANPKIEQLKKAYPELFIWFNPKATWSTYQASKKNTQPRPVPTLAGVR